MENWPDRGNTAWAAMAGLGSIGLIFIFFINILFTIGQLSIQIGFHCCTNMVYNHNIYPYYCFTSTSTHLISKTTVNYDLYIAYIM